MSTQSSAPPKDYLPASVTKIAERLYDVRARAQEAVAVVGAKREAIKEAQRADRADLSQKIRLGEELPADGRRREAAAQAEYEQAVRVADATRDAEIQLERELLDAITESAAKISAKARTKKQAAAERYAKALGELRDASRDLAVARAVDAYMDRHEGHPNHFHVPRLTLPDRLSDANSRPALAAVIDGLGKVLDEPEKTEEAVPHIGLQRMAGRRTPAREVPERQAHPTAAGWA